MRIYSLSLGYVYALREDDERLTDTFSQGTFLDSAIDVIPKPSLTDADLRKRLMTAVRDAHAYGLTSVHDAALLPESLAFFKRYVLSC